MKQLSVLLPFMLLFTCCKNKHIPDASGISVDSRIERFDKYVFQTIDTGDIKISLVKMQDTYPYFGPDFLINILGLQPISKGGVAAVDLPLSDSGRTEDITANEFKRFLRVTRPLYDSISVKFKDVSDIEKELKGSFQFVKYYFPAYKVPKLVSYVGPFDAPGVAITSGAMAIGLQLFAGKDFSFYTSTEGQELYPMYISRRFERQYITPDCMKAVAEDLYPDQSAGRSLIEQTIEKGKHWYLLSKFIPEAPDSLVTNYTGAQTKWVNSNEGLIWNFMLQGTDIYTSDPAIVKNFIGEAPSTNGMPEASPGNIGQWIGWQIVKAYTDKHPEIEPKVLMMMDAKKIFSEAKYKPK